MFGYIHFCDHKHSFSNAISLICVSVKNQLQIPNKSNSEFCYMRLDTPIVIEMPRLRILNANFDTPKRQFPVGTTIQLTCQGEIGSDASKVSILCLQESDKF